jgi:seryl-tRNA synthetase
MSKTDYLTEDTSLLPKNQSFVCLSFLTPTKEDKATLSGIKIRGVFSNYEEACEHAKKVQSVDKYHNVFVGEMGKWLAFDPDPDSEFVKDSEYANQKLNSIMKNYQENQEKSKLFHEHQKNIQIQKNLDSNIEQRQKNKQELNETMVEASEAEKEKLVQNMDEIEKQIQKMEERKQELKDINKGIAIKLKLDQGKQTEMTV